jgi:MarR family transcriptional regulator, organic hydroperoxide resistance regulator
MATKTPQLEDQLCFAVYSLSLAMTQAYKPLLAELGLTYPQYLVMLVLWREEQMNVHQIASRLHLDPGSVTPLIKRLCQDGWLQRERDANDERKVIVRLTADGKKLSQKAKTVNENFGRICAINSDDVVKLRSQISGLRDHINPSNK